MVAVVGIDHYAEWPRLENAENDARGTARLFRQLGFVEVTALLDKAATGKAMHRLVTDDLAHLSPDDSLVLFFAGHGYTRETRVGDDIVKTGCLIPVDAQGARAPRGQVSASWVQLDNWLWDIARLPPRHILVIIDACHSGVALSGPRWRGGVALSGPRWRGGVAPPATDLDALQTRRSRRIITSALDGQQALDSGPRPGHSLFTGCLIEGLWGGLATPGRHFVTGRELGLYLRKRVHSYSNSDQTPDVGEFPLDDRGDIVVPVRADGSDYPMFGHEPSRIDATANLQDVAKPRSGATGRMDAPASAKGLSDELDRAIKPLQEIVALDNRNYDAYRELERLYRQASEWKALVKTYRDHITATADPKARVELYVLMGATYDQHLGDIDRAIEAYSDVLGIEPDEQRALDALGRLHEKVRQWDRAVDMMAHLITLASDSRKQADLYWRMARIQYAELGNARAAESNLRRGLVLDPGHVPTMEALIRQYSDRGDWTKAAQMIERAEGYTAIVIDKARLLFDAARIYQDKLHQDDTAKQLYAAVIALEPEHIEAGRRLVGLYFATQQWTELSAVINMLCCKVGQLNADPRELNELYYRAARTTDELGDYQKALGYYKAAYDIDSTYLPTLVGRADLLFKMQDFDAAVKLYQAILVQHRDEQGEADVVRIYNRLGMARQALGERKKALNMFEKVLEIDPTHRDTLEAVIELQQQQGDWEAVIHAMRGLMVTSSSKEKTSLLSDIGGIYHDKLQNPQKAIATYLKALEGVPEDQQLLRKVLNLYTEIRQWKKVVEIIERLIALEPDPVRRGSYYHAAATVCRDEIKSLDEAVGYYNKALDSFFQNPERLSEAMIPRALKSFEAIDKILTAKRDWKAQAHAYRHMIERLPVEGPPTFRKIQVGLFDGLGEICRSRLKQYQSATQAFEIAQKLDPRNEIRSNGTDRTEILAELYLVAGLDYADKAVEQHMRMLRNEPFKYDSYKALRKIYMDAHQYDKTWCVCNTLAFLYKTDPQAFLQTADPDELQFYEQHKRHGLVMARNAMTLDTWAKVVHPDENRYISAILGACWQGVAAMKAFPHKDLGIKPKERRQLQDDPQKFSQLFSYVAQFLNVQLPEVYFIDDNKSADIQLANAIEKNKLCPSFVIRPPLLQAKPEREIAFLLARRLTFMRPEYYLKMLLPTNIELQIVVLSAIVMVQPQFPVPPRMRQLVRQYLPEMQKRMPAQLLEQLGVVVARFIQAAPEINLAKWGRAVDTTSHRAGFVMCGDLEVAARMVSTEPVATGSLPGKDTIKELVLYSISEEFFTVRTQMGLTIAG